MTSAELKDVIENAGYETRSYSGRELYGKECIGVSLDKDQSEMGFAADVVEAAFDEDGTGKFSSADVVQLLHRATVDQLGKGLIIYFPRMEWVD